jgi:hypothetical protein
MFEAAPPPSEEEARAFTERLRAFHDSLPGNEHLVLDALVLAACGEQPTGDGAEPPDAPTPSRREVEGFWQRLQEFHDSLPGDAHRFVDALAAQAKGEGPEVRGYHGQVVWSTPNSLVNRLLIGTLWGVCWAFGGMHIDTHHSGPLGGKLVCAK